ncbi:MAG: peptidoglycan recognition family protein [Anaerolineales bacterium]
MNSFSRKDFLQLTALLVGTFRFKNKIFGKSLFRPSTQPPDVSEITQKTKRIFELVPELMLDQQGVLRMKDGTSVPQYQTFFNRYFQERELTFIEDEPYGIMLHSFGESEAYRLKFGGSPACVPQTYVMGLGEASSAAFVIGEGSVPQEENFGVIQTEKMSPEGIPYRTGHCMMADESPEWYMIKAYNKHYWTFGLDRGKTIYFDFFGKNRGRPNARIIGVESAGSLYDQNIPPERVYANTIGLLVALMKRYEIAFSNIFGHYEFDSKKSDPGKIYLYSIRQLLLMYINLYGDDTLKELALDKSGYESIDQAFKAQKHLFSLVSAEETIQKAQDTWGDFSVIYTSILISETMVGEVSVLAQNILHLIGKFP